MRFLSVARILLIVPVLMGAATSAEAAVISFTQVHNPADITLTVGGTEFYTFTHDLALATPALTIPPDQVLTGTLALALTDPGGSENVLVSFDLGSLVNYGPTGASDTLMFDLANTYGGTVLINSLNADGKLQVTVRVGQQGGPTSSFVFASSTLSGRAEVASVSTPEPASFALLATGLAGWWGARRRGRARA